MGIEIDAWKEKWIEFDRTFFLRFSWNRNRRMTRKVNRIRSSIFHSIFPGYRNRRTTRKSNRIRWSISHSVFLGSKSTPDKKSESISIVVMSDNAPADQKITLAQKTLSNSMIIFPSEDRNRHHQEKMDGIRCTSSNQLICTNWFDTCRADYKYMCDRKKKRSVVIRSRVSLIWIINVRKIKGGKKNECSCKKHKKVSLQRACLLNRDACLFGGFGTN